jgi:hypothetical protein
VGTREAMELLGEVHKTPDYVTAHAQVESFQRQLDFLAACHVNAEAEMGRTMSQYGIFALCLPLVGSMVVLSKSGLTGTAAMIGMLVGFIGVPTASMLLVRQAGKARVREKQAEIDGQTAACKGQLETARSRMEQAEASALARLWNEREAQGPREAGTIEKSDQTVKIGNVVVPRAH